MTNILVRLYNNQLDADVQIQLRAHGTLPAHSLILKNGSPVLRAMLSSGMLESSGKLSFDYSDSAVKFVVRYMYGCGTSVPPEKACKIMEFAHYLQMDALFEEAYNVICANGTVHKCFMEVALLAENFNQRVFNECMQSHMVREPLAYLQEIMHIATHICQETLVWVVKICKHTAFIAILTIFYGVLHMMEDLVSQAACDVSRRVISRLITNGHIPVEYARSVGVMYAKHACHRDTCGCGDLRYCCSDCGYQYCYGCATYKCPGEMYFGENCPRCCFILSFDWGSRCVKCIRRKMNSSLIFYCTTCGEPAIFAQDHAKCSEIVYGRDAWIHFIGKYGASITKMKQCRLAYLVRQEVLRSERLRLA